MNPDLDPQHCYNSWSMESHPANNISCDVDLLIDFSRKLARNKKNCELNLICWTMFVRSSNHCASLAGIRNGFFQYRLPSFWEKKFENATFWKANVLSNLEIVQKKTRIRYQYRIWFVDPYPEPGCKKTDKKKKFCSSFIIILYFYLKLFRCRYETVISTESIL